jgi:hypothetical protein
VDVRDDILLKCIALSSSELCSTSNVLEAYTAVVPKEGAGVGTIGRAVVIVGWVAIADGTV